MTSPLREQQMSDLLKHLERLDVSASRAGRKLVAALRALPAELVTRIRAERPCCVPLQFDRDELFAAVAVDKLRDHRRRGAAEAEE